MSAFDSWYAAGGTGSGDGSGVGYTSAYRAFLERFMGERGVRSVLDVGCGDWQFSSLVNWGEREYVGTELVQPLVDRLRLEHGSALRRFQCVDLRRQMADRYDLAIVKDVAIHLPNADVIRLADNLSPCCDVLYVYDHADGTAEDIAVGQYRALDLRAEPFKLHGDIVYRFPKIHNAHKVVLHVSHT